MKCCRLKKVIYSTEDFKIAVFKTSDNIPPGMNNSKCGKNYFTAVGYFPTNNKLTLELEGSWEKSKYGYQFKVTVFQEEMPSSKDGIIAYLSSGLIKGVGRSIAERIYSFFGDKTFEVLDNNPEELLKVKGISKRKLSKIVDAVKDSKSVRNLIQTLVPYGIEASKCIKVHRKFGADALKIVKENPYAMTKVKGIGFLLSDKVARGFNTELNSPDRLSSAITYVLESKKREGHLCYPQQKLLKETFVMLNEGFKTPVCTPQELKKVFVDMAKDKILAGDRGYAYLKQDYDEEVGTSILIVKKLLSKPVRKFSNAEISRVIGLLEDEEHVQLAEKQKEAIIMEVQKNFCITTGGPGTGKSTSVYFFLKVYEELVKRPVKVQLLAPCARAARRLGESCFNFFPSSTIHSALGLTPDDDDLGFSKPKLIDAEIIIVDESSMCDSHIFYQLLKSVPKNTKLILMGDPQQLPSVGAGNVLAELLSNFNIPRVKLETIFRQGEQSLIVKNSVNIEKGIINLEYGNDFTFDECADDESTANKVVDLFLKEYQGNGKSLDELQILSPFRKEGVASGATELNRKIQSIINPPTQGKIEVKRHGYCFRKGDKVIQTANTDKVSNGDMGIIKDITYDKKVIIQFLDKTLEYDEIDMDEVDLAYAISIHKFQGSECNNVIIPIITKFYVMLKRNLIYTGITRGKKKVSLVGEEKAITMAIKNNDVDKRNTFLSSRINDALVETY